MLHFLTVFVGDYLIFFIIIPLVYFLYKDRKLFFKVVFAVVLAKLIETGIKQIFPTPRPYEVTSILPALYRVSDASFPSGHTSVAVSFAATTFCKYKRVGTIFLFLAILIGIARVIGGVHYAIDIFGGFLVGILSAFFVSKLVVSPIQSQ